MARFRERLLSSPCSCCSSGSSVCPHHKGLLYRAQPWGPAAAPAPQAPGLALPATTVLLPGQDTRLLPPLPVPAMTSLGTEDAAAWGAAPAGLPTAPWPSSGLHAPPAFPAPYSDTSMAILLHAPPICLPWSLPFSPHPRSGAAGASEMPPAAPAVAPNLEPPPSIDSQGREDDKWETHSEEPPCLNSRSSSPLQLNLLQEEVPGLWLSPAPARRDLHPKAEGISDACCQHTSGKVSGFPY